MRENETYRYDSRALSSGGTRWAEDEEIRNALSEIDLGAERYDACGIPLVSTGNRAYVDDSDNHTLILGSTGSKKTRLLIMPAMNIIAKAGESVICTDPKGELYQRTAGLFEQEGYRILVLNLRDPEHSNGWSPLHLATEYMQEGSPDKAYELLGDLAASLFPYSKHMDRFWPDTSRALFTGLAGLLVERPDAFEPYSLFTMQDLLNMIKEPDDQYGDFPSILKRYPEESQARQAIRTAVAGSEKTFSNISVSYRAGVQVLYSRETLTQVLSTPDIRFETLGKEKTALFIIMPDEKTTLHPIVSLIIKQCYERLIHAAQNCEGQTLPIRVNFMLDEFSNLPTIADMSSMISAARSRNIRFTLVVQSINQLVSKYEEDAFTIRGNCNNWVFLTSRELAMLMEISELCGESNRTGERLISVSQLQRLNKQAGEALILNGRNYPYITNLADIDDYCFPRLPAPPLPVLKMEPHKALVPTMVCNKLDRKPVNPELTEDVEAKVRQLLVDTPVKYDWDSGDEP